MKIAPGPRAKFWDECLAEGYVCVGWDAVGDLRTFPTKEAFAAAFRDRYGAEYNGWGPQIAAKGNELWTLTELRPGDLIVANRGMSEVLAVGEVVEPGYLWLPEREEYKHAVAVRWDTSRARHVPKQTAWGMRTVVDVPEELWRLIAGGESEEDRETKHVHDAVGYVAPPFAEIVDRIHELGLRLGERTLRRYHLALGTRGFVVLSGLSGAGKTWLAEAYAEAVGARHLVVPVAPNWTTNEDLLGFANPLTGAYHDTAFGRFLREAQAAWEAAQSAGTAARPFHAVLDEMTLARVEYYFAQLLSAMEVRARRGTAELVLGPGQAVLLTPNLKVVGTVNVDETTHGFADKVYDRAQLIEVEARREDLEAHLAGKPYAQDLLSVWDAVRRAGPFAFRVLDEVAAYVAGSEALGAVWEEALDEQLLQKVLPKLKGADPSVGEPLGAVLLLADGRFPLSHAKAGGMLEDFRLHGFASYFR